ncbi:Crp/Fnr family transcriptional regulator [Pseudonocardia acaciae]|uniref:Crp/Fnr family transcriptional regulator n=1 Tax=Pseudonocardia acaciae TaxID=551276 RepID=UPI00055E7C1D|nr:Crp/Fnr family transcriptional regulator [Pseudonocardia acaciae]
MAIGGWRGGWQRLRQSGRAASFTRGERLLIAGTPSDEVLLLEAGVAKVVLPARDGSDSVLGFLGAPDLIGERGVMSRQPRSSHVVALTAGYTVHVAARTFLRLRAEHTDVQDLVDRTLLHSQERADARQLAAARNLTARVAVSLLQWAADFGQQTEAGLLMRGISQRDIAQALTASEKSVEVALRALRNAALLETGRLSYLITNPDELQQRFNRCD